MTNIRYPFLGPSYWLINRQQVTNQVQQEYFRWLTWDTWDAWLWSSFSSFLKIPLTCRDFCGASNAFDQLAAIRPLHWLRAFLQSSVSYTSVRVCICVCARTFSCYRCVHACLLLLLPNLSRFTRVYRARQSAPRCSRSIFCAKPWSRSRSASWTERWYSWARDDQSHTGTPARVRAPKSHTLQTSLNIS